MDALDECVSAANHVEWLCLGIAHDNQRMPDCPHVLIAEVHEASDCRMLVRHSHASGSNGDRATRGARSEEHTSELQSRENLVCRLLLEKKKKNKEKHYGEKK